MTTYVYLSDISWVEVEKRVKSVPNGVYVFKDGPTTISGLVVNGEFDGIWFKREYGQIIDQFAFRHGKHHGFAVLFDSRGKTIQTHWYWHGELLGMEDKGERRFYRAFTDECYKKRLVNKVVRNGLKAMVKREGRIV